MSSKHCLVHIPPPPPPCQAIEVISGVPKIVFKKWNDISGSATDIFMYTVMMWMLIHHHCNSYIFPLICSNVQCTSNWQLMQKSHLLFANHSNAVKASCLMSHYIVLVNLIPHALITCTSNFILYKIWSIDTFTIYRYMSYMFIHMELWVCLSPLFCAELRFPNDFQGDFWRW